MLCECLRADRVNNTYREVTHIAVPTVLVVYKPYLNDSAFLNPPLLFRTATCIFCGQFVVYDRDLPLICTHLRGAEGSSLSYISITDYKHTQKRRRV